MPAKLSYKVVKDYLNFEISGVGSPAYIVPESRKLWTEMGQICDAQSVHRVLANMRFKERLPIRFCMDIARYAQETGWSPSFKLALVTDAHNHMALNLVKSFMVHLGYEVEVFLNKRNARKWLLTA